MFSMMHGCDRLYGKQQTAQLTVEDLKQRSDRKVLYTATPTPSKVRRTVMSFAVVSPVAFQSGWF